MCNGFKRPQYVENIQSLINNGFENLVAVLDNKFELDLLLNGAENKFKVGIRIASEEEPKFDFYTSRLGIRHNDILPYYYEKIKDTHVFHYKKALLFIRKAFKI